jgi:hypothetical protein
VVLTQVTEGAQWARSRRRGINNNDPAAFEKFRRRRAADGALSRLMVVVEQYPI